MGASTGGDWVQDDDKKLTKKLIDIGKLMLEINNGDLERTVDIDQISERNGMSEEEIRDLFNLGTRRGYFKSFTTQRIYITEHGSEYFRNV